MSSLIHELQGLHALGRQTRREAVLFSQNEGWGFRFTRWIIVGFVAVLLIGAWGLCFCFRSVEST